MNRYGKSKRNFYVTLVILFILSIGIGYAVLTQQLTINNTISYDSMKWDVGFSSVADNGGTITSTSSIGSDGKSITVNCDFGLSTSQESCIVKATIVNNGTFDVALTDDPIITYDDTYIHTLTFKWNNHPTYENHTVLKDNFIAKGESEEVILTIKSKFLTFETLPTNGLTIPITITLNFEEYKDKQLPTKNDLAVLKSTTPSDTTSFRSSTYKEKIKNITFEKKINIPSNATESWDIGVSQNGNVMAYVIPNQTDSTYYDLYIQSNTQLYANKDMSCWFHNLKLLDSINNLDLLNTSMTTSMSRMFWNTGYDSTKLQLDVSNFDTSSVTNTSLMFTSAGYKNPYFTLDVSNFDTSNVTNMIQMFYNSGYNTSNFTLDVSNFDTSNVKSMDGMFYQTAQKASKFTLDVSNFDTSNVTNMSNMFQSAGYSDPNFTLDVSHFDTSNVTNMRGMFIETGKNSTILNLDVSNFDTSQVTDMSFMFQSAGYSNPNFTLDVSNFDTRNVTNMEVMFDDAGYKSTVFAVDVSNFDTSKVTDMSNMFRNTGYNNITFTLDVSNFDTSKVTDMSSMFSQTGYNSTKLNTSITIRNPNITSYSYMFNKVATKTGSQITVNYTSETEALVDAMIATKSSTSNVVKGVLVD